MSTVSASPAEKRVLVWDLPVRVTHWLMALSFAGAWLTAESERWRLVHVSLGWTMAGLIAFRLVWGLVGSRHARFGSFVRGPAAAWRYLRSLVGAQPEHHVGHNPAGALAIVALLGLGIVTVAAGWATEADVFGGWAEELHEGAAGLMLGLVVLHIAAVVLSSRLHHENLVAAMINGRKAASPGDATGRAWRGVGALLLVAVLGFWWLQWRDAPMRLQAGTAAHAQQHDDDDD